jgi:hypothetical protein
MTTKFTFQDGKLRPTGDCDYPSSDKPVPLAVVCTPWDLQQVNASAPELADLLPPPMDMERELALLFAKYEVPIGLLKKLRLLRNYDLNFILDDSSSMIQVTSTMSYDSDYMNERNQPPTYRHINRWTEQEDRLHLVLSFLCYIPTGRITIRFLNRTTTINLTSPSASVDPKVWLQQAHTEVAIAFTSLPSGCTPIYEHLRNAMLFSKSKPTMTYLFTDGQPTDSSYGEIAKLLKNRPRPESTPVTLVSCTDVDSEVAWMKQVDEAAPYVAEVDDYQTEREEVIRAQGQVFPFTKGVWIICLLVAALDPKGLDALDERHPMTLPSLSEFLGRNVTKEEYDDYLRNHPSRRSFCSIC